MTMAAFYLRRKEFPHAGSFNVTFGDWDADSAALYWPRLATCEVKMRGVQVP